MNTLCLTLPLYTWLSAAHIAPDAHKNRARAFHGAAARARLCVESAYPSSCVWEKAFYLFGTNASAMIRRGIGN
jgi:hypothetical protein